jgi:hypothetical protein
MTLQLLTNHAWLTVYGKGLSTVLPMERFYLGQQGKGKEIVAPSKAQEWLREFESGEVAKYAELCYRLAHQNENEQLFQFMRLEQRRQSKLGSHILMMRSGTWEKRQQTRSLHHYQLR